MKANWRRMPTPRQAAEHAKKYPVPGSETGLWVQKHGNDIAFGYALVRDGEVDCFVEPSADDGVWTDIWTEEPETVLLSDVQWRPVDHEGMPVPWPRQFTPKEKP